MVNVSVSVNVGMRHKMSQFGFVNWSEVVRQAISKKISELEFLEKFTADSDMTENDALRLGAKVNKGLARRLSRK